MDCSRIRSAVPSSVRLDGSTPVARSAAATPSDGSTRLSVRTNGTMWRNGPSGSSTKRLWPNPDAACGREPRTARRSTHARGCRGPVADIRRQALFQRRLPAVIGCVGQAITFPALARNRRRLCRIPRQTTWCGRTRTRFAGRRGEVDVVHDDLRGPAREVIDQHRVHDARPRPAAGESLDVPERFFVDLDERDVLARCLGADRVSQAPVVRPHLDGLERLQSTARRQRRQQPVESEYEGCGTQSDQNTGGEFAHA